MEKLNQRQGFLVSAIVHLVILMVLASSPVQAPRMDPPATLPPGERTERVFLPPREVLRQLLPTPRAQGPRPTPPPVEPPRTAQKDRMSIGGPSHDQTRGPLVLRREDDLTQTPKGRPDVVPGPQASPPPPQQATPPPAMAGGAAPLDREREGLRLPPGVGSGPFPRGDEGQRRRQGAEGPSIASSLRNFERRLQDTGARGVPTGTGQQMGPLFFDPQGADFTLWINHWKNEVYRNWIVPTPALMGFRGHVDFEFTVARDGSIVALRMLKSTGTPALDRAAENALRGSRMLPLPDDYGPPTVTMQVAFYYNEGPQGS